MHHCTVDKPARLRRSTGWNKAPGVDGVTKAVYAHHPEENLQALHQDCTAWRTGPSRYTG